VTHSNQPLIDFLFLKLPPPPCAVLPEGSLEVKRPTKWTDEKQRRDESEKKREEERISKKRKSQKKEDPSARKVGKSRNAVFFE